MNSLLLIFCSFRLLFLKCDSNPKHFSFYVFYFNVSKNIFYTTPRLLNFKNFPKVYLKSLYFFSLDFKALYTGIPNSEGIAAVKRAHNNYQHKAVATKVLITFLVLILVLNNFIFNSKSYLEIKGCVMRTIFSPAYTYIFMVYLKKYSYTR